MSAPTPPAAPAAPTASTVPAASGRSPGAWVVGASSGIGRATAARLARDGYTVAVSGRREDRLAEVVREITGQGGRALAVPVDVTGPASSLASAYEQVVAGLDGPLEVLVCSAGTNVTNRWWSDLTPDGFDRVVDTNLGAVTRAVLTVLPGFRANGFGQVVVVSSWAGWQYMSAAGAAYSASKTGLGALVQTLNDQEGRSGVRATHLCPGEVATDILRTRPVPPPEEEMARMLDPDDVAEAVGWLTGLRAKVCVNELVLTPVHNRMYVDTSAYPPRKAGA
ncbi:SDR family oxidoreductase [Streptomyces sp. NPDC093085]|uniref:SDR family oxidoreductase n=1 Tax=Streptomyces sp. NPDC093085 TaxID=3155068 RepID=UPI00343551C5